MIFVLSNGIYILVYYVGNRPGEVFVHRNVGNCVPGSDLNVMSVLEYAVAHLKVTDIIVAGHYDCGAVKAALSRQDLGILENWIRHIRDVYRLHQDYLDSIVDSEDRHRSLVELNVIEQCLTIYKTGVVQRTRMNARDEFLQKLEDNGSEKVSDINKHDEIYPRIHGMVFNPYDGLLVPLKVDLNKRAADFDHIYGLYDPQGPE